MGGRLRRRRSTHRRRDGERGARSLRQHISRSLALADPAATGRCPAAFAHALDYADTDGGAYAAIEGADALPRALAFTAGAFEGTHARPRAGVVATAHAHAAADGDTAAAVDSAPAHAHAAANCDAAAAAAAAAHAHATANAARSSAASR